MKNLLGLIWLLSPLLAVPQEASNRSAFALESGKDAALLATGLLLWGSSAIMDHDPLLTSADLARIRQDDHPGGMDANAVYQWKPGAGKWSTFLPVGMAGFVAAMPLLISGHEKKHIRWTNAKTLYTMYAEAWLLQAGLKNWMKNLVERPRPFLFNGNISDNDIIAYAGNEGMRSFWSGHSSGAFMTAAFIISTWKSGQGTKQRWLIGSLAVASALTAGYLRYASGTHYPSDIAAGALAGSAIGFLVPLLHKTKPGNASASFSLWPVQHLRKNPAYFPTWALRFTYKPGNSAMTIKNIP